MQRGFVRFIHGRACFRSLPCLAYKRDVVQRLVIRHFHQSPSLHSRTDEIREIDKETLQLRLDHYDEEPFLFIDVREPFELKYGEFPRAINIPLGQLGAEFGLRRGEWRTKWGFEKPTADTEIVFTCRAGPRADAAANLAYSMGYVNSIIYFGSFKDWFPEEQFYPFP